MDPSRAARFPLIPGADPPPVVVGAEGAHLTFADGTRILDAARRDGFDPVDDVFLLTGQDLSADSRPDPELRRAEHERLARIELPDTATRSEIEERLEGAAGDGAADAAPQSFRGEPGAGLRYRLAWSYRYRLDGQHATWVAWVDATDGELLAFYDDNRYACPSGKGAVIGGVWLTGPNDPSEHVRPMPFTDVTNTVGGPATTGGHESVERADQSQLARNR